MSFEVHVLCMYLPAQMMTGGGSIIPLPILWCQYWTTNVKTFTGPDTLMMVIFVLIYEVGGGGGGKVKG